ncbi:MAG: ABC transporter permease [Patescibacteria group bacterium]
MKYPYFVLMSALSDLFRNKLRTFLTSLGILIGVASVVLLLAFGLGLKEFIREQFDSLGTNLVFVLPGRIFGQGGGFQATGALGGIKFDEKDLVNLKKIDESEYTVGVFSKTMKIQGEGKSEYGSLYAASSEIFPARNLEIDTGVVFDKNDVDKRSKVVVMGPKIAEKLFGQAPLALGKNIRIEGTQSYKVIGVLKSKGGGGFGGPDFDSFIYIPYKTAYVYNPDKIFVSMLLRGKTEKDVPVIKEKVKEVLLKRYKEDDFTIADSKEFISTISSIFAILNSVLVAIGAVSLVVGGIGIMNIMYVSVTERIREIGIRRALGARERDILFQFLAESVLLSLIGGVAGLGLALGIVFAIQSIFPAIIDGVSILLAVGTSSFIGIFFGVFPAKKAASLSPMDAIRYE